MVMTASMSMLSRLDEWVDDQDVDLEGDKRGDERVRHRGDDLEPAAPDHLGDDDLGVTPAIEEQVSDQALLIDLVMLADRQHAAVDLLTRVFAVPIPDAISLPETNA
jgi:hypothetical protein